MNDEQLIEALGGVSAVARLLDITPASVSGWNAIPPDRKIRLAVIAEDLGISTRKILFPESYQNIWPELRPCRRPKRQVKAQTSISYANN